MVGSEGVDRGACDTDERYYLWYAHIVSAHLRLLRALMNTNTQTMTTAARRLPLIYIICVSGIRWRIW